MTEWLFNIAFVLAAPFWVMMIILPRWSRTARIVRSPLIVAPLLVVYAVLVVPDLPRFWAEVTRPSLQGMQALLGTAEGTAAAWAHLIAFDLLVGRWMYLDNRDRGVHPLIMAPMLVLTILLAPLGLLAYLAVRAVPGRAGRSENGA